MSQTERILFIDRTIQSKGKVTTAETAAHFEVSTRQIKRDIEYLRDRFSAPLIYDTEKKGYLYSKPFKDLAFADQKLTFFYIVMKSLTENGHYIPVYSDSILSTIESDVPGDFRSVCSKISYQMPQAEFLNQNYFMDICIAMRDKKAVNIRYTNLKNEETQRLVDPEHMINYSGSWYIICWDRGSKALKTFNLSRINAVESSSTAFEKHTQDYPSKQYKTYKEELEGFIASPFGIFKGKKLTKVTIRFYEAAQRIIESQIWHPGQIKKTGAEKQGKTVVDYTDLSFPVADYTEVLSKILSFGPLSRPVEPADLVDLWKERINSMVKLAKG
ncbi:MAG: WYL domain-containing protein [Spirochaetaceae bacterium]|nr:WYL domain-containing protein [Spirochaetaceae bacterium]